MSKQTLLSMALAAGLLLTANVAQALDFTFSNKATGDYNTAADWTLGHVPTSSESVVISSGDVYTLSADVSSVTPERLWVGMSNNAGAEDGNGTLTLSSGASLKAQHLGLGFNVNTVGTILGKLYLQGGSLTIASRDSYIGGSVSNATCRGEGEFIQTGGAATFTRLFLGNSTNTKGTLTITGDDSTFTATGTSIGRFGTGIFDQTGGSVTFSSDLYLGLEATGDGTYTISDGSLSIADAVTVGAVGTGKFEVEDITAMITWSGPSATFGANSTLSFVAAAAGVSDIVLSNTSTGALSIDAAALLSFDLSAMSSAAQDLLLVDNYGTDTITGAFSNYAEGDTVATFGDGSFYKLTYVYDAFTTLGAGHDVAAANDLALVAIPEPSTLALLATGLIGLLAYAWRKRRQ